MTQKLNVTVSDKVYAEIEEKKGDNRSEFVEELIRIGLSKTKKRPGKH